MSFNELYFTMSKHHFSQTRNSTGVSNWRRIGSLITVHALGHVRRIRCRSSSSSIIISFSTSVINNDRIISKSLQCRSHHILGVQNQMGPRFGSGTSTTTTGRRRRCRFVGAQLLSKKGDPTFRRGRGHDPMGGYDIG